MEGNEWLFGKVNECLDRCVAIWIPAELHQAYRHSLQKGYGMADINEAAFSWLAELED
jgi:hypothetical protein